MEQKFVAAADASDVEDLPCLQCPSCKKVCTVGGSLYMNENYDMVDGGWMVPWCTCVNGL